MRLVMTTFFCVLSMCAGMTSRCLAQEARPEFQAHPDLTRSLLWVSASATLASAGLGGYFALHVDNIYDRARSLPSVSPELSPLHDSARTNAYVADGFFSASLLFGVASLLLLWLHPDSSHDKTTLTIAPTALGVRGSWL
jgi:hypothetical protein